jgi:type I restriction enzyme M protein
VGVIVPHGVLFRGGNEGKIRRALIEENLLDAVIGLPENLFFGTQIPAAILIFDRRREAGGSRAGESEVLFVNASFDFSTNKTQNCLDPGHISKIVDTFQARRAEPKYSALATREQLRSNDHNLNIPRYVDSYDEDGPIDISQLRSEIASLERELATVRDSLDARLRELGI